MFRKLLDSLCIALLLVMMAGSAVYAQDIVISQNTIQTGKTGRSMTVSFQYTAGDDDTTNVYYGGIYCGEGYDTSDVPEDEVSYVFPFETPSRKNVTTKIGSLKKGTHTVSVTMKVRRDISEGYYSVPVFVSTDEECGAMEWIKIYISQSKTSDNNTDTSYSGVSFELGEGQITPYGVYPSVMNFSLNLRNSGTITAQNVKASIVCGKDSEDFPFDINEANYDRRYDLIGSGETVELPYSFAIRSDAYSGFYPIRINVSYRESSGGELKNEELTFFVHIKNKDREKDAGEFNANNRVKARIVVDSFRTEPETVLAGSDFELYVIMKNASEGIEASNILFSFESEKAGDSPVFAPMNGSNSVVVNKLSGNETAEIRMSFSAAAGVDPRSYGINIVEKYDSPEFKNAEEKVTIVVPVRQIARFNMGTVEILPDTVTVGDEVNVMFPVNNTGKTVLYNCMVYFSDDTVNDAEVYLGNIKPGESANVDTMLKTRAPSTDDTRVSAVISYEDEYGEVYESEKYVSFTVNAAPAAETPEDYGQLESAEEKKPWYKSFWIYLGVGVIVGIVITVIKHRKKKKEEENT